MLKGVGIEVVYPNLLTQCCSRSCWWVWAPGVFVSNWI